MTKRAQLRPIAALRMPDIVPGTPASPRPKFINVEPSALLVDETYQRDLGDRSVRLIRRIVAGWDWRAFKPPVVVADGQDRYHVLDGQHTAIAAASHPLIKTIPIMVVEAAVQAERANAFVKHNRDRLQITNTQLHAALVAAGDTDALTIEQVCARAGARVLKHPPGMGRFAVGDTMAIQALKALIGRRHAQGARRVVEICVQGQMAPVSASGLKAVEELLFGQSYAGEITDADLVTTIREMGVLADKEAARFSAEHDLLLWKALTVTLFRNTKKVRRGRREAA